MIKVKIALFSPNFTSIISMLIAALTKAPYSHAAIFVDGTWYDADESRGYFSITSPSNWKGRHVTIWEFEVYKPDADRFLNYWLGNMYDYRGVLGYLFRKKGNDQNLYCFEAAYLFMQDVVELRGSANQIIGSMDIVKALPSPDYIGEFKA